MPRTPQFPGDQPLSVELDTGFVGVNDKVDPALLRSGNITYQDGQGAAGLCAAATNNRFIAGLAQTRPGSLMPVAFNPTFNNSQLLGAGIYSDPDGREWMALAQDNQVRFVSDGATPVTVPLDEEVDLSTDVEFTQCFGDLVLWRGPEEPPLYWNGDPRRSFFVVTRPPADLTNPEAPRYLKATPPGSYGIVAGDRLWVVTGRDTVAWSDLLDYRAFDLALNTARLNSGEDDAIVALHEWESSILVFKDQSIFRLLGTTGDLSTLAAERINRGIGCLARRSVAQVGAEVFWLAQGGVYKISQAFESRLQANPIPLSDSIDNTMRRINWTHAHRACGIVVDRYYYLAVPMDQSTRNNVLLVLDTTTMQWQGMDTFADGLDCRQLLQADLFGRKVPFAIDHQFPYDGPFISPSSRSGRIIALDQPGDYDHRMVNVSPNRQLNIEWSLTTRGYALGELGLKRIRSVRAAWGQQGGESRISLFGEGPGEGRVLSDWRTYDRTKYTRHGFPAYDTANGSDTFSQPYREDYSWVAGDGTQPQSGLPLQARQHYVQGWPLRAEVRWIAFTFENRAGGFILKSVSADGLGERNVLTRRN